ncbi:zinc ribbon domain-containing protein [Fibrobacter succinogenes]
MPSHRTKQRSCKTAGQSPSGFILYIKTMTICPHCGAELKQGATFCPHCGSDKNTGWKEGAEYSDLDLPDYDEIVENEFGEKKKKSSPLTIVAVVIVVLAFMAAMVL